VLKRIHLFIPVQFGFIVLLLSALSAEYQANPFMQQWFSSHVSPVGYLLNGYLAAMLIGVSVGGAVLVAVDCVRSRRKLLKRQF